MNTILFDDDRTSQLYPLTLSRPTALIRCGIMNIAEKWERVLNTEVSYLCADYLAEKFPLHLTDDNLFINGRYFPASNLVERIQKLKPNQSVYCNSTLVAFRGLHWEDQSRSEKIDSSDPYIAIEKLHQIFTFNHEQIASDFELICSERKSEKISETNTVLGQHPIFIEAGAKVEASCLNSSDGPIYIGKNAEVMEGSLIRGPFALCHDASVKMGAKIYGGTTVGPHSKVGGELNNAVIFGYSNKGHDGFLGNAVLGEWCNLGADSNNSNLKNNYEPVKLWNYSSDRFEKTGEQFCGLIMGDHSKCGINTMFNTGTVIGVSANIFGSGFPRNFVPSFSWGGAQGFETYQPTKAFQTADLVMQRRHLMLTEADKKILNYIFNLESKYRHWEKS